MGTRLVGWAVTAVTAAVLLLVVAPGFFGVAREAPFAQLVAFRAGTAVSAVVVAAVLVVLAVLVRQARRLAVALAVVAIAFAVALGGIQAVRGSTTTELRPHRLGDVRVLSWNLLRGAVDPAEVAARAAEAGVDVVALQEAPPELAQTVADRLASVGLPFAVLTAPAPDPALGTALLISTSLGTYTADAAAAPTTALPSIVARPATPERPVLVSAHAAPPLRSMLPEWRSDLARLASLCTTEEDLVVIGDLNSTVDHWSGLAGSKDLGDCTDAGVAAGGGAVATWPASAPTWLGASIDHVAFAGRYVVSGYRVLTGTEGLGSDHRPLLVQLSIRGMGKDLD